MRSSTDRGASVARALVPLFAALSALTLSACMTVGPDFKPPAPVSTAAGYAMDGETTPPGVSLSPDVRAAGPWWQAFGSPALDQVERLALAESPSVAAARASLERFQAGVREA